MAHHLIVFVAAVHVPRRPRAMSSALPQLLRLISEIASGPPCGSNIAACAERDLQPQRDFSLHVGELLLEKLRLRQRPPELLPRQTIVARRLPAELRPSRPRRSP